MVSSRFARPRFGSDRDRIASVYPACLRWIACHLALMRFARIVLIANAASLLPSEKPGFRYAGLTCCVITRFGAFAIVGRVNLSLLTLSIRPRGLLCTALWAAWFPSHQGLPGVIHALSTGGASLCHAEPVDTGWITPCTGPACRVPEVWGLDLDSLILRMACTP